MTLGCALFVCKDLESGVARFRAAGTVVGRIIAVDWAGKTKAAVRLKSYRNVQDAGLVLCGGLSDHERYSFRFLQK